MKKLITLFSLLAALMLPLSALSNEDPKNKMVTYSEIRQLIDGGAVESADIRNHGWRVTVYTNDNARYYADITPNTPIADHLYNAGVTVRFVNFGDDQNEPYWKALLFNLMPAFIFFAILFAILGLASRKQEEFFERLESVVRRGVGND